jgi:hypothetical protein
MTSIKQIICASWPSPGSSGPYAAYSASDSYSAAASTKMWGLCYMSENTSLIPTLAFKCVSPTMSSFFLAFHEQPQFDAVITWDHWLHIPVAKKENKKKRKPGHRYLKNPIGDTTTSSSAD